MYAAGEKIDVSQSSPFSFPNFVNQGLAEPLDDLPGAADYIKDFTPFTKQVATIKGKTMGLPYFSAVWVWNYYADMLEKLKIDKPFATLRRIHRALRKGQEGRRVALSHPVDRRRRPRAAAGHLVPDDLQPRRHLLRQAGQPHAGRRLGRPRDAEMVGQHLREGPRHRRSRIAEGAVHQRRPRRSAPARISIAGRTITTASTSANDPAQSPIAGKVKALGSPGDGKTIGVTHVYFLSSANRDKEWAWKLLQYLGGKTKDGNYTQAVSLAKDAMLGSGYTSVMNSDAVKLGWAPWGDVPTLLKIWDQASYIGEACSSVYQPWHFPWTDQLNIEVQKCLTGQITPDQCCDNLIKGIADAKRKV